jgi:DNA polymerase III alpha subunit
LKFEKEKEAEELFVKFIEVFKDNFYAELQINEVIADEGGILSRGQFSYNQWLIEKATRFGVPLVITGDVHYVNKEDYKTQELSFNLRADKEDDEEFICKSLYYHKTEDFLRFNKDFGYNYKEDDLKSWIENSTYIADKVEFIIPERDRMFLPRMAEDEEDELVKKTIEGLKKHFGVETLSDVPKEYQDRIKHELNLILRKGVSRYFLVLNDICDYADNVGISRGSARGCFLPDNTVCLIREDKPIQDVKSGDKIYTGFGTESYVDCLFEYNINEEITILKTDEGEISSTKDHKILILKRGLEKKKENLKWVEASSVEIGDFLVKV